MGKGTSLNLSGLLAIWVESRLMTFAVHRQPARRDDPSPSRGSSQTPPHTRPESSSWPYRFLQTHPITGKTRQPRLRLPHHAPGFSMVDCSQCSLTIRMLDSPEPSDRVRDGCPIRTVAGAGGRRRRLCVWKLRVPPIRPPGMVPRTVPVRSLGMEVNWRNESEQTNPSAGMAGGHVGGPLRKSKPTLPIW
jgi:hypothetical protein